MRQLISHNPRRPMTASALRHIKILATTVMAVLVAILAGCAHHHDGLPYWVEWSDLERETIKAFPLTDNGEERLTLHTPTLKRGDHGDTALLRMKGVVKSNEPHKDIVRFDVRVNMRMDYYPDQELVRFVHYENFQFNFTDGSDAHRNEIMDQAARTIVRRLHDHGVSPVGVERPADHRPHWRKHKT